MAWLIKPDNTVTEVQPKNGRDFSLTEMYELVECDTIQIVNTVEKVTVKFVDMDKGVLGSIHVGDAMLMVIDDNGKINGKQHNEIATEFYEGGDFDPIVGNCLICSRNEVK